MNQFILVANSTIDETAAYYTSNGIRCASLSFTIDGMTVKEDFGATLPFHDFFEKLREGKTSTTSQAQVGDYLAFFRDACETSGKRRTNARTRSRRSSCTLYTSSQ